ncbi:MAG: ribosomal RNA small subunit methyltransferase A [Anaerolinea sp.]|nr:ribosomal RNA small subunit methyltransferase A [Anaerolinea sp.]
MTSSSNQLTPLDIPSILRQAEIKPSRGLGQNFLNDDRILTRIVEAGEVSSADTVLEIGPGLGSLTRHLANAARVVTAVEIDRKIFPLLQKILQPFANIHLVCGDILEQRLDQLDLPPGYLVVANIPYYITSAVIRYLLEAPVKPARIVLTVQHEVAQRICALSGDLNLLALSVQVYGAPSVMMRIPSGAFYPPPKVDSAVVRIDLYSQSLIPTSDLDLFFRLCKAGFGQKRKTLRNSLSGGMHLPSAVVENRLKQAGIDPMRRAETLSLDDWQKLVDNWKVNGI